MKLVTLNQKIWLNTNANASSTPATLGTIVTANKSTTQAASVAADIATIVSDFNALLAKLKTAGIVS